MDIIHTLFSNLLIPVSVVGLVLLVLLSLGVMWRNNYIKVPPNQAVVVSGRKHRIRVHTPDGEEEVDVGYRLVKGGATFVWPFLERKDELNLSIISIADLVVSEAITKEGVPLTVKAVANIRIGSEDTLLSNAVEKLLGKDPQEIRKLAFETLEGHLRSMLGTLTVEEVNSDRAAFSQKMISESQTDLAKLGLKIEVLTVKELSDKGGYLEALGKKRTAEVKRDAEIGKAQAERMEMIEATTAQREGEVEKQGNLALEAEAEKKLHVKQAEYDAEVKSKQATAAQAGPIATATAMQEVTLKQTKLAELEAARKEQELLSTVVRPAEAQKAAAIAGAQGEAEAVRIKAEGEKERKRLEGLGEAEATKAKLLAEAEGIKAKLLAEAEGVLKKAEAYEKLNASGQLLQILEAMQTLIPHAIQEFAEVMRAAAAPLGNADKIVVLDGGNGNGSGALERFAGTVPNMVFGLIQKAEAMGLDVTGLLGMAGIKDKDANASTALTAADTPREETQS